MFYNRRLEGRGIHKWLQYFPAYERHLGKFIGKDVHIVEIGIQSGGSLDMWKNVFGPGAQVYGCDINPECKAYEDNRTQIFIGDQGDPRFWEDVRKKVPRIDILIDDGSHVTDDQISTLGTMLQHLSPGGVYITEDVHSGTNPFWQRFKLEDLVSPAGNRYKELGSLVSSVHIYPYLLVLERGGKTQGDAMLQQLGARASAQPAEVRVAVAGANPRPTGVRMNYSLGSVFPWLRWEGERNLGMEDLAVGMAAMQPGGWLFVRDGSSDFTFDTQWDDQADLFMSKIITDFQQLHDGNCCNWIANTMQKNIESLHVYPHLLIAKRTDGKERLVKAPQHGTRWIPY